MDTQKRSPSASTIEQLIKSGKTLAAIGADYGVSRQRIHQILNANGRSVGAIRPHKGHGVNCPHCGNDRLHAHAATSAGNPRLYCPICRRAFVVGAKPKSISQSRTPPKPEDLVNALQDSIHKDIGQSRPAKTTRKKSLEGTQ